MRRRLESGTRRDGLARLEQPTVEGKQLRQLHPRRMLGRDDYYRPSQRGGVIRKQHDLPIREQAGEVGTSCTTRLNAGLKTTVIVRHIRVAIEYRYAARATRSSRTTSSRGDHPRDGGTATRATT